MGLGGSKHATPAPLVTGAPAVTLVTNDITIDLKSQSTLLVASWLPQNAVDSIRREAPKVTLKTINLNTEEGVKVPGLFYRIK